MSVWFLSVFVFFSLIHGRINHYMLVLSTPFAVLVAYFLTRIFQGGWLVRVANFYRKFFALFIIGSGCLAMSFLRVFLLGGSKIWLVVFGLVFVVSCALVLRSKKAIMLGGVSGVFIISVYFQSALAAKAGLVSHATLQQFAYSAQRENMKIRALRNTRAVISVGSHDIHEKEFQAYFSEKVLKAATSEEDETRQLLEKLFLENDDVLCLILKGDYGSLIDNDLKDQLQIVHEDYIFRRRIAVDAGLFEALLRLDSEGVRKYFMEEIVLVRKSGQWPVDSGQ